MQRDIFSLKDINCGFNCGHKAYYYVNNEKGDGVFFFCYRCRSKVLYVESKHKCYYCGHDFFTKYTPLMISKKIVCIDCFRQIKSGVNIKVIEENKKMRCLGGKINLEVFD